PAACGVWQFSQPFAATVLFLVLGQGSRPEPFQVAAEVACTEAVQALTAWHSVQSADAVLSLTRNLPYLSLCGSWQEVHCTWLRLSRRTSRLSVCGSCSSPWAVTSAES